MSHSRGINPNFSGRIPAVWSSIICENGKTFVHTIWSKRATSVSTMYRERYTCCKWTNSSVNARWRSLTRGLSSWLSLVDDCIDNGSGPPVPVPNAQRHGAARGTGVFVQRLVIYDCMSYPVDFRSDSVLGSCWFSRNDWWKTCIALLEEWWTCRMFSAMPFFSSSQVKWYHTYESGFRGRTLIPENLL